MLLALLFLLLLPLKDERPDAAEAAYTHALRLFEQGRNAEAHKEAAAGWARYQVSASEWAGRFRLLDAHVLIYMKRPREALRILSAYSAPRTGAVGGQVEKLTNQALAWLVVRPMEIANLKAANSSLDEAEALCGKAQPQPVACGEMWLARGSLARTLQVWDRAQMFYLRALNFARGRRNAWQQASALEQLGYLGLNTERPDASVDWSRAGNEIAAREGYEDLNQLTAGNLGVAWWRLGDLDRALEWLEKAEKTAAGLGDLDSEQVWVKSEAGVFRDRGALNHDRTEMLHAEDMDEKSLALARQMHDPEQVVDALGEVALLEMYADTGDKDRLNKAEAHLKEAEQIDAARKQSPSPFLVLLDGEMATARHDYAKGAADYRLILANASSPVAERLNAGNDLGRLYEAEGKFAQAESTYKSTIAEWIAARSQLKHADSALSFGTNATLIYRNYVRFLVKRGRAAEALALADQSRARTLAEGLGIDEKHLDGHAEAQRPEQIARKTGATLLFYWLDKTESYLWVVTPQKTAMFTLPGETEIAAHVENYRKAVLNLEDPIETRNPDGEFLYHVLVAPARGMVDAKKPVIVLADGALNELNFETLPAPGTDAKAKDHYLIEDWTVEEAASLDLLAHGGAAAKSGARKMLLMGNPVTEDARFPALPYFGAEMKQVAAHFDAGDVEVLSRAQATPAAYEKADPEQFEFIHFVSHATASQTIPLDSAILLSAPGAAGPAAGTGAYRLYAREILAHPLHARLVTISACDGAGTRTYAGEGLIGLSWAFLRAGARQVVAALWEVSDDSTPKLMNGLYAGIVAGKTPAESLREAKLELLHTQGRFRLPFYWAAFQVYSRE